MTTSKELRRLQDTFAPFKTSSKHTLLKPVNPKVVEENRIRSALKGMLTKPSTVLLLALEEMEKEMTAHSQKELPDFVNTTKSKLIRELIKGNIQFSKGRVVGKITTDIKQYLATLGGIYSNKNKTVTLERDRLPQWFVNALEESDRKEAQKARQLLAILSKAKDEVTYPSDVIAPIFKEVIEETNKRVQTTIKPFKNIFKNTDITVYKEADEIEKKAVARHYTDNLETYSKKFVEEEWTVVRQQVIENINKGDGMKKIKSFLRERYGVQSRKAHFLARQETHLCVNAQKNANYATLGITDYIWEAHIDARPDHFKLNGKKLKFSNPPVTNHKTGATNNPGEDFGCRCFALPVLPIQPREG